MLPLTLHKSTKLYLEVSLIDWLAFNFFFLLLTEMRLFFGFTLFDNGWFWEAFMLSNIAYVISQQVVHIQLHERHNQPASVLNNSFKTAFLFITIDAALFGMNYCPTMGLLHWVALGFIFCFMIMAERLILRKIIHRMRRQGRGSVSVVLYGESQGIEKMKKEMSLVWTGYRIRAIFQSGEMSGLMRYLDENPVEELFLCTSTAEKENIKEVIRFCKKRMIRVYYVPVFDCSVFRKFKIIEFGSTYIYARYNNPLSHSRCRFVKRMFDIVFSLLFLCTVYPFVYIIIGLLIKITMPGPIYFRQERTGYNGKSFKCLKFRSMRINKDANKRQATKDDPRITPLGHFLRHTNLDELPQFINVLKGDMSVVGPRPHMLEHTEYYSSLINDYMIRHYVAPGITGWAQTHGERGETRTVEDMQRRVEKDIWYIEHWSVWLDIQIILKTILNTVIGDDKAF